MAQEEEEQSPELHAGFIFLMDLAIAFRKCTLARDANDFQGLFRHLEGISLMLTGYYAKKRDASKVIGQRIGQEIRELKGKLNAVVLEYEQTNKLKIPQDLWLGLYILESELRDFWKISGLQMRLKNDSDSSGEDFS